MERKQLKGNKGEWSEFYTLVKILCDWKLYSADENLGALKEIFYPVLKVINQKGTSDERHYSLEKDSESITIVNPSEETATTVIRSSLKNGVNKLFDEIKKGSDSSFGIELADELLEKLDCVKIKAGSQNKADIFLVIHDINTGYKPEVGFSIKSQLGGNSTLLNPSGATNFIFEVTNSDIQPEEINSIVGSSKIRDRLKKIYELNGKLKYVGMDNGTFESNLRKIDSLLPDIVAEMLLAHYRGISSKMKEIIDYLEEENPLESPYFKSDTGYYSYKVQNLLECSALGMVPNTPWSGHMKAHGGYIIVKEDGEIVCYHLYNLDQFREYLLRSTRLETPSTTRYKYGSVYREDGKNLIKLNLQIRFVD